MKPIPVSNSTTSVLASSPSLSTFQGKVYTVKIMSNWGNGPRVQLSSMALLDDTRKPLPIASISSIPSLKNPRELEKLVDRNLVKTNNEEVWAADFPPENFDSISIILMVEPIYQPHFLRVWNSHFNTESSVREILVTEGTNEVYKGEVPQGFGFDAPLAQPERHIGIAASNSSAILAELFPHLAPEPGVVDLYGNYPRLRTKKITIEIVSTRSSEEYVALNGIDLFDYNLNIVRWRDVDDIIISNCSNFTDPARLFRVNKESVDANEMFMAETKWRASPTIEIKLSKPINLARVKIWNFNASTRSLKFGVNRIKIYANDRLIWNGVVQMGTGRVAAIGYNTTVVWLTDLPNIREKENFEEVEV